MNTKRFQVYAPVFIPTLCRYEHFKRCIDSLKNCTGSEYTDVYIGIDYPTKQEHWEGHQKICSYVKDIVGFNNLFIYIRDKNLGAKGNVLDLKAHVREKSDRFIFSEDDNEFSPNFLEYMNEGLTRFKDSPMVIRICGSRMTWGKNISLGDLVKNGVNAFPAKDYNASGFGAWFNKAEEIPYTKSSVLNSWRLTYLAVKKGHCAAISRMLHQLRKETQLPDVCMRLYCSFHNYYCIFPIISKVRNWGYDGTGINSDNNKSLIDAQELDLADSFIMNDLEIKDNPVINNYVKKVYGDSAFMRFFVMVKYLYFRITGRDLGATPLFKAIKKVVR